MNNRWGFYCTNKEVIEVSIVVLLINGRWGLFSDQVCKESARCLWHQATIGCVRHMMRAVSYLLYLSTNIYINYFHLMIGTCNALTVEWTVDCVKNKNKHPTNCSNFMGNSLFVIFNSAIILIINSRQLGIIKNISPTATSENVVHFKLQPNNCTGEIFLWENAVSFLAS